MSFFQGKVGDIVSQEGLFTCKRDDKLGDIISEMKNRKTSSAIIEEDKKAVGIFTEKDFFNKTPSLDEWTSLEMSELMSPNPKSIASSTKITQAIRLMRAGGFRHIVVTDEDKKAESVISMKDIVFHISDWLSKPQG